MNYKLVATEIGDLLKYDTTVNGINRIASAIFCFEPKNFPNQSITSTRARCIYNWIMSLDQQYMDNITRNDKLATFCFKITPQEYYSKVCKILSDYGISTSERHNFLLEEFNNRKLHREIHIHSKRLFLQGNFFHAVFEACKVYNKLVKTKAQLSKDGYALMNGTSPIHVKIQHKAIILYCLILNNIRLTSHKGCYFEHSHLLIQRHQMF